MAELRPSASLKPKQTLKGQLIYRLKFSGVLDLSEKDFAGLIAELEADPLMRRLMSPDDPSLRAVTRKRYPDAGLHPGFYELDERTAASPESVDVESVLERHKGLIGLIRKIGRDKFERYFLYKDDGGTLESAASACGVSLEEAGGIESLLLEVSVRSEFFRPSGRPAEGGLGYVPVARVEKDARGNPALYYLSPHSACGRFEIDREKLQRQKARMTASEKNALSALIQKIEWVNMRQDSLHRILAALLKKQEAYLKSGSASACRPVSQRKMSRSLKVSPSTVCRAIYAKSVILPWGEEVPLKELFRSNKDMGRMWVKDILDSIPPEKREEFSDSRLKDILKEKHGLKVSRRSVNIYRRSA